MKRGRPPTRAVLFDLDDTLVDHLHSSRSGLAAVQQEVGFPPDADADTMERLYRELLLATHDDVVRGRLDPEAERVERFRRFFAHFGRDASWEVARHARRTYRQAYLAARRTVPGARELLEALRGRAAIGVVTDNLVAEQVEKLEHFGLAGLVDALVVSEEVGVAKPDPGIFLAALRRVGCGPGEAVMMGDSWERDVMGARAAGLRAVWLNRYGGPCPAPTLAEEVLSLKPAARLASLLLGD
jgi:putative hydrolase of the HAD superfamily